MPKQVSIDISGIFAARGMRDAAEQGGAASLSSTVLLAILIDNVFGRLIILKHFSATKILYVQFSTDS